MTEGCHFDFMDYMDEQSIDSNLICNICHKPFKDPVTTPCDHAYGRACITHWLEQNAKPSCPTCLHEPLLVHELTQASRPLRAMLDQFRVRCTLCEQTGLQRGNFVDHINKSCPQATVTCQAADIKCPWTGPRVELPNHAAVCVFEPLRPVLGSLIADNAQLRQQMKQLSDKVAKLVQITPQSTLRKSTSFAMGLDVKLLHHSVEQNDSGDESDESEASSFSKSANPSALFSEENAIFIRNLPAKIKIHDLFTVFSSMGKIQVSHEPHGCDAQWSFMRGMS